LVGEEEEGGGGEALEVWQGRLEEEGVGGVGEIRSKRWMGRASKNSWARKRVKVEGSGWERRGRRAMRQFSSSFA